MLACVGWLLITCPKLTAPRRFATVPAATPTVSRAHQLLRLWRLTQRSHPVREWGRSLPAEPAVLTHALPGGALGVRAAVAASSLSASQCSGGSGDLGPKEPHSTGTGSSDGSTDRLHDRPAGDQANNNDSAGDGGQSYGDDESGHADEHDEGSDDEGINDDGADEDEDDEDDDDDDEDEDEDDEGGDADHMDRDGSRRILGSPLGTASTTPRRRGLQSRRVSVDRKRISRSFSDPSVPAPLSTPGVGSVSSANLGNRPMYDLSAETSAETVSGAVGRESTMADVSSETAAAALLAARLDSDKANLLSRRAMSHQVSQVSSSAPSLPVAARFATGSGSSVDLADGGASTAWAPARGSLSASAALMASLRANPNGGRWEDWFAVLADFFRIHGHCSVSKVTNLPLAKWIVRQRRRYRMGRLSESQKRMLDNIGFRWDASVRMTPTMRQQVELNHLRTGSLSSPPGSTGSMPPVSPMMASMARAPMMPPHMAMPGIANGMGMMRPMGIPGMMPMPPMDFQSQMGGDKSMPRAFFFPQQAQANSVFSPMLFPSTSRPLVWPAVRPSVCMYCHAGRRV
jgi:hypothetical protein